VQAVRCNALAKARECRLQDLGEVDRSKGGRPKAIDKYQEELMWSQLVHSKWVTAIQYIHELEAATSCSLDSLLWLMDVERRWAQRLPFLNISTSAWLYNL
jgi:hypothetical protein